MKNKIDSEKNAPKSLCDKFLIFIAFLGFPYPIYLQILSTFFPAELNQWLTLTNPVLERFVSEDFRLKEGYTESLIELGFGERIPLIAHVSYVIRILSNSTFYVVLLLIPISFKIYMRFFQENSYENIFEVNKKKKIKYIKNSMNNRFYCFLALVFIYVLSKFTPVYYDSIYDEIFMRPSMNNIFFIFMVCAPTFSILFFIHLQRFFYLMFYKSKTENGKPK